METKQANITNELGAIHIADEVVATIAGMVASEVEGVIMSGGWGADLVERLGRKNLTKGVKVQVSEDAAGIDVYAVIEYGYTIPKVAAGIQKEVKIAVERMTGLKVTGVNIHVLSVTVKKEESKVPAKVVEEEPYI